ncbi:hypothetical protein CEXT_305161, partial [Caerostris extrusa]
PTRALWKNTKAPSFLSKVTTKKHIKDPVRFTDELSQQQTRKEIFSRTSQLHPPSL